MTDLKTLTAELAKIQKAIKAPKSQYNKFGGYYYRNCEDILEALKPLIPDGYSFMLTDEVKAVGSRYYVCAKAIFTDGNNQLFTESYAREEDSRKGFGADQLTGAASTYARKYALNGLLLIDDTKDADSNSAEQNTNEEKPAAKQAQQKQQNTPPSKQSQPVGQADEHPLKTRAKAILKEVGAIKDFGELEQYMADFNAEIGEIRKVSAKAATAIENVYEARREYLMGLS